MFHLDVLSSHSALPQLTLSHTVQGYIGGQSKATCGTLTNSGIETSLRRKKKEHFLLGKADIHYNTCFFQINI